MPDEPITQPPVVEPPAVVPEPPAPEPPAAVDPVSGKPWMEIAKENERKAKEAREKADKLQEKLLDQPSPQPMSAPGPSMTPQQHRENWLERFGTDPYEASRQMVGEALTWQQQQERAKKKLIRETRKRLKAKYSDYSEFGHEFEDALDELNLSSHATPDVLETYYQGLRGSKLDEIIAKKEEEWKKTRPAPASTPQVPVVGPTSPTTTPAVPAGTSQLDTNQQKECAELQMTPETYLVQLRKHQERAKALGNSITPRLISDRAHPIKK